MQLFKAQTLTLAMYFGIVWMEPRLVINETATEWTEFKFGPPDEVNVLPEAIDSFWYVHSVYRLSPIIQALLDYQHLNCQPEHFRGLFNTLTETSLERTNHDESFNIQ